MFPFSLVYSTQNCLGLFLLCLVFEKGEVSPEVCGFGFDNLQSPSFIAVIFFLTVGLLNFSDHKCSQNILGFYMLSNI